MKILLDECIPRKFKRAIAQYTSHTVPEAGFAGKSNGELLDLAERAGFHVFVTLDKGIEYQQNLVQREIAVVILSSRSSQLADLLPLAPECIAALSSILPGQIRKVSK